MDRNNVISIFSKSTIKSFFESKIQTENNLQKESKGKPSIIFAQFSIFASSIVNVPLLFKKKGKVSISDEKKKPAFTFLSYSFPFHLFTFQNSTQRSKNDERAFLPILHFEISKLQAIPLSVLSLKLSRPPGYSRLAVTTPLSSPSHPFLDR